MSSEFSLPHRGVVPELSLSAEMPQDAEALVVPVFQGEDGLDLPESEFFDGATVRAALDMLGATGAAEEVTKVPASTGPIVAVGVGKRDDVDAEKLRRAAGVAARSLTGLKVVATTLGELGLAAAVEGIALGAYTYRGLKTADVPEDQQPVKKVVFLGKDQALFDAAVITAEAVAFARDLVNAPSSHLFPESYAAIATSAAEDNGLTVEVLDDAALVAGVNDRVQLAMIGAEMNRRICEQHMRGGATIVDPASTWIDVQVEVGQDVIILPNTQLKGTTRIANNCEIGPDSTLKNMIVREGASVVRTHGSDSQIGAGATVGPFTYLRPGTVLGDNGKLGGFVETKNAQIGRGSKVPHLTYVGDATIGEESNIGASSVFVNYDGVNKHHTTIGSHVRTGSDTMFIAPVTVGDGAYSGAGTVIKEDVPPGALVVSGGPQRIIEGWVVRKRPGTPAAEAAARALDADSTQAAPTADSTQEG